MNLTEMKWAQMRTMRDELDSAITHEFYGDDSYDDLTNGLEFLHELVTLDYELREDEKPNAVEVLMGKEVYDGVRGVYLVPAVGPFDLEVRPCHMLGLDSLAPEIREEYYQRHPEERI